MLNSNSPMKVMEFEKLPICSFKHLMALNISAMINGKSVFEVLIEGGSTLNLIPYKFFKKLGKRDDEIINREVSEIKGVFIADLTLGIETLQFFFHC